MIGCDEVKKVNKLLFEGDSHFGGESYAFSSNVKCSTYSVVDENVDGSLSL